MMNAKFKTPPVVNEPIKSYAPGTAERKSLKAKLSELLGKTVEIPMVIGGKEIKTGNMGECRCPFDHAHILGKYHKGGAKEAKMAIEAALAARAKWAEMPWEERAAIFLRAAEMLARTWRDTLNAATMLGLSKTAFQAEIDAACELIDFYRFNVHFMEEIYSRQPFSPPGIWDRVEQRPLEGFVFAVTPFNFTSIAGNLPTAPALMGNVVVWKPASSAVYPAHYLMRLWKEAGLPDGVINLALGSGGEVGDTILEDPRLAGIHFTGSTATFLHMWKTVGENIGKYKTYPRLVGETGGKDFVFAHSSADVEALNTAIVTGAFQFQGQKCSAASRAYIPDNLWPALKEKLVATTRSLRVGPPTDFRNFMGAVIDKTAFKNIKGYINFAKGSKDAEIIVGGGCDDSKGYFIEPTIIVAKDPKFKTMREEIFGPVMTIYVYPAKKFEETLQLCDETSPYALTGSIFARDREAALLASRILRNAAGNFYINDKPTGAVVGQQPFGGSRASGTNDKAGSAINLMRWVSPRAIKENFLPPTSHLLPHNAEE
jgi:1-pyrroline-5-carboxylate dehydrogenase